MSYLLQAQTRSPPPHTRNHMPNEKLNIISQMQFSSKVSQRFPLQTLPARSNFFSSFMCIKKKKKKKWHQDLSMCEGPPPQALTSG